MRFEVNMVHYKDNVSLLLNLCLSLDLLIVLSQEIPHLSPVSSLLDFKIAYSSLNLAQNTLIPTPCVLKGELMS